MMLSMGAIQTLFLSTLSLRRATVHYDNYNLHCVISIHALLAESDALSQSSAKSTPISIHALLAESDTWARGSRVTYVISIHALLAESDVTLDCLRAMRELFLSTLSLRRATMIASVGSLVIFISIHALLAESDQNNPY